MGRRKKGTVKRAIVTPDKHFPLADWPAISCLTQTIEIVKPDIYVDLGDVGEWAAFSHHEDKRKKPPPLEYKIEGYDKDVEAVNAGMDVIDEALDKVNCKEKYITEGNHDNWLNLAVKRYPYIPQYKFKNAVKLKDRGYKYYQFGKRLKLGKLYLYHGHRFGGQYHTANHLRKKGVNYMYGHHHDVQHMTVMHEEGPIAAWSLGCLKDMSPEANAWLDNADHNWGHAFAIVDFFEKGYFTVHVIQIINGRTSLWGQVIDGNK